MGARADQEQSVDILRNVVGTEVRALQKRRLDGERRAEVARQVIAEVERRVASLHADRLFQSGQADLVLEETDDAISEWLRLARPVDAVSEVRHRRQYVQAL